MHNAKVFPATLGGWRHSTLGMPLSYSLPDCAGLVTWFCQWYLGLRSKHWNNSTAIGINLKYNMQCSVQQRLHTTCTEKCISTKSMGSLQWVGSRCEGRKIHKGEGDLGHQLICDEQPAESGLTGISMADGRWMGSVHLLSYLHAVLTSNTIRRLIDLASGRMKLLPRIIW